MKLILDEYTSHERVMLIRDESLGLMAYIVVDKLLNGVPAFGATRYATYASPDLALADAAHLSRLMTYKSVMADLPYGGAKAVIMANNKLDKNKVLLAYAQFAGQLYREFVTGADIGVSQEEVALMRTVAPRNMVGTQLDPVAFTIDGLILALNQTIQMQFDKKSVDGFSFAIQGAGKIGEHLLRAVYPKAKKVYITDINLKKLSQLKKEFPNIEVVGIDDIYSVAADFFSPCAVSHSLNKRTIKQLKCKVILGGANIQLDNAEIGVQLHKMGILYIPDYVANAGGLISVTDEYEHGKASQKRIQEKLLIIPKRVKQIIGKSRITHTSTSEVADEMAEKIIARFSTKKSSKKVS